MLLEVLGRSGHCPKSELQRITVFRAKAPALALKEKTEHRVRAPTTSNVPFTEAAGGGPRPSPRMRAAFAVDRSRMSRPCIFW